MARFVGRVDERYRPFMEEQVRDGLAELLGPLPVNESFAEMLAADFLLLLLDHGPGAEGVMTSKIFSYLATGKPILTIMPPQGVAARLVQDLRAGLVADPDEPAAIGQALRQLLSEKVPLSSLRERSPSLRKYSWPVLAEALASLLHDSVGPSPARD